MWKDGLVTERGKAKLRDCKTGRGKASCVKSSCDKKRELQQRTMRRWRKKISQICAL